MRYRLREGLYHCIPGSNAIFLDLPQNRYFALSSSRTRVFKELAARNGEFFAGAEEGLSSLIRGGYLVGTVSSESGFVSLAFEPPSSDTRKRDEDRLAPGRALVAIRADVLASFRLNLFSLESQLNRLDRTPSIAMLDQRSAEREVNIWVSAFDRAALIRGRTNRCLARSLAMARVLRARGIAADFVIGVRSDPFSAHAWVQHRGIVLNDTIEQVGNYSPILVLRCA